LFGFKPILRLRLAQPKKNSIHNVPISPHKSNSTTMQNVEIETLTPVHIGSGIELQSNFEYLHFAAENCLVLIDEKKVLDIIGEDRINQWVACIEKKESLLALIRQRKPDLTPQDVAQRIIPLSTKGIVEQKTVREQLHSGNGQALMPGSSLKGALRTAVWAYLVRQNEKDVAKGHKLGRTRYDNRAQQDVIDYKDATLMGEFMGKNPNEDIMRLLQVGDATFETTICYRTDVANHKPQDESWALKPSILQYVEAIPAGKKTQSRLSFQETLRQRAQGLFNPNADLIQPDVLFDLVNKHTRKVIADDLKFLEGKANSPLVYGDYIDTMNGIMDKIDMCGTRSCILRLGYGTGYRSMTGDWLDIFYSPKPPVLLREERRWVLLN
jgi:CRISPR-associated protein Csm5